MGSGAGKGTSPGSRGREPLVFVSQLHKACRRVEALLGVSPPSADSGIWGLHDAAAFQRRGETGGYMRPSPAQPGTGLHVLSPVVARGPSPPFQVRAGWEPSAGQLRTPGREHSWVRWSLLPRPGCHSRGLAYVL